MDDRVRDATAQDPLGSANLADGAELAVLIATRSTEVLLARFVAFVVATVGLVVYAAKVNDLAGWLAYAAVVGTYVVAVTAVDEALSPHAPDPETARRLAADVVVTREGKYELTPAGKAKVELYWGQLEPTGRKLARLRLLLSPNSPVRARARRSADSEGSPHDER